MRRIILIILAISSALFFIMVAEAAVAPEPPRNVQVAAAPNAARVNLSWEAPATPGFIRYRLYRSTAQNQNGAMRQDEIEGLSFTDTTVAYNTTYYYRAAALLDGVESRLATTTPLSVTPTLPPPVNVRAADTKIGKQIKINWERPTMEIPLKYNVYRSTVSPDLGGAVGADIVGMEFLDTTVANGAAYYYRVKSVEPGGALSAASSVFSAIATDTVPPDPPSVSASPDASGRVSVSWSAPRNEPAALYYLYRSTSPSGAGGQIFSGAATSYGDVGQVPGAILYYRVTARDAAGNISEPSEAAKAVIPGSTAPVARAQIKVSDLAADGTPRPEEINLHWRAPDSSTIAYARIYRSEREGEAGGMMADKVYGSSFLDKLVQGGKRYYYIVRLVDKDGAEYQGAPQVNATPFTQAAVSAAVEEEKKSPPAGTTKKAPKTSVDKNKTKAGKSATSANKPSALQSAVKPPIYVYGQPRLTDLKKEAGLALKLREELRKALKGKMPLPRLWPQLVKQYIYGGYAAWEIAEDLKFGPGLVHPTLLAAKWRTMWGYGKHKK